MTATLHIIQIVSSLALIALVLLQRSSGDMGSAFGEASFMHTKRGAERFLFVLTIVMAVIFAGTSIAVFILTR